ncbi:urease alpha subunit [Paraburkholderia youngii]
MTNDVIVDLQKAYQAAKSLKAGSVVRIGDFGRP